MKIGLKEMQDKNNFFFFKAANYKNVWFKSIKNQSQNSTLSIILANLRLKIVILAPLLSLGG